MQEASLALSIEGNERANRLHAECSPDQGSHGTSPTNQNFLRAAAEAPALSLLIRTNGDVDGHPNHQSSSNFLTSSTEYLARCRHELPLPTTQNVAALCLSISNPQLCHTQKAVAASVSLSIFSRNDGGGGNDDVDYDKSSEPIVSSCIEKHTQHCREKSTTQNPVALWLSSRRRNDDDNDDDESSALIPKSGTEKLITDHNSACCDKEKVAEEHNCACCDKNDNGNQNSFAHCCSSWRTPGHVFREDICMSDRPGRLLSYLYLSYFLCRWGDRMWEFAVGLFMVEIWKKSLLLTSLYGLVETTSVVAFGVILGECVDKFPRLKVIQSSLLLQNISVFSATMAILILLSETWPMSSGGGFKVFNALVILVNVMGGISALASLATKISLERDWVVILAREDPSGDLTKTNAVMRRIDLACTLLAAMFVGLIMSAVSVEASAVFIATWNISCVGVEYWLLLTIYKKTPRLHERKPLYHLALVSKLEVSPTDIVSQHFTGAPSGDKKAHPKIACDINLKSVQVRLTDIYKHGLTLWNKIWPPSLFEGWKVYLRQENMLAGISFSLLSVSVLSFGTLMTATLKWRGCPAYVLGLARALAAVVGISATLFYPLLHARLQTQKAGLFSIALQWAFLTVCVVSIWPSSPTISTLLLIVGAAAARAGLWMFDLSVTQLMQESVPEVERGVVAGVQNSMQSFFQLLSFVVGIIMPNPQDFSKLILMSFGSVTMAALLYAVQVYHACTKRERTVGFLYKPT